VLQPLKLATPPQLYSSYLEKDMEFFDEEYIGGEAMHTAPAYLYLSPNPPTPTSLLELIVVMDKDVDQAAGLYTKNLAEALRSTKIVHQISQ